MKTIDSFLKDHDKLNIGFYKSGESHGVSTFDLRFKKPNTTYISPAAAHTIEHILATTLRNSKSGDNIIYFGPMGCLTGFYLLTVNMRENEVKDLLISGIETALEFETVPGSAKKECGNYKQHDLTAAKMELKGYLEVLNG